MKKSYFNTCPYCKSNLDPGEKCECKKNRKKRAQNMKPKTSTYRRIGTMWAK